MKGLAAVGDPWLPLHGVWGGLQNYADQSKLELGLPGRPWKIESETPPSCRR